MEKRAQSIVDEALRDVSQRYKMQEELGAGAQATVYKATHRKNYGKVPTQPGPAPLASSRLLARCPAALALPAGPAGQTGAVHAHTPLPRHGRL